MARKSSADVGFLLVSGMNVLGDMTELSDTQEALIEEVTALGDEPQAYAPVGVSHYELSQSGFYNDASNRSNAALATVGASKVLSYAPEGNTAGARCVSAPLVQADYKRQIARGELTKASASYQAEGPVDNGVIVQALGAVTADGDSEDDSIDNGASSSDGGAGVLQVSALTLGGFTDFAVKVRHSADDATYADLISFTAVTAVTGERKTVSGTVNRYLAASWDFEGSGSSPSATFMVAFART